MGNPARTRTLGVLAAALALFGSPAAPSSIEATPGWPGEAHYSIPLARLDAALGCRGGAGSPDGSGRSQPVLLVHGAGVGRALNWAWGYWAALHDAGFEVCWIELPRAGLGDAQDSAEYVARAIEVMHRGSGERIDVIGHSLGSVLARWVVKHFPSGYFADDLVGFGAPNHGTTTADRAARAGRCFEACWQMRTNSKFVTALNDGDETPGHVSQTSIYTANDELVRPIETSRVAGGANIRLQDVCLARPVDHFLLPADALTWELTIDALTHPGPADQTRLSRLACFKLLLPGVRLGDVPTPPESAGAPRIDAEPSLEPYAR
jgi:triacylglycerol lipase